MALNYWKCLDSLDLSGICEGVDHMQTSRTRRNYSVLQIMSPVRKVDRSGAVHTDEERRRERETANRLCCKENNLFLLPLTEE